MRVLIVDDEAVARQYLRDLLDEVSDVEIVGECDNGDSAIERLRTTDVDVVFLDIKMPGRDGFEVARHVLERNERPALVFVTAYDAFALRAFDVHAVDADPEAVAAVRRLTAELAPGLALEQVRTGTLEDFSGPDGFADVVICSAVLHFARDDAQFEAMLRGAWRPLRSGGLFFARLASSVGLEDRVEPLGGRRHRLPDGTTRYLVDEALLMQWTDRLGGRLLDPLKTTVVQDQRSMTTWVVRKRRPDVPGRAVVRRCYA